MHSCQPRGKVVVDAHGLFLERHPLPQSPTTLPSGYWFGVGNWLIAFPRQSACILIARSASASAVVGEEEIGFLAV
jgi:hypothetical protein